MNPLCELPGLKELFDISLGVFNKERLQIFWSLPLSIHWVKSFFFFFALYGMLCKHQGCKILSKDLFFLEQIFFSVDIFDRSIFQKRPVQTTISHYLVFGITIIESISS